MLKWKAILGASRAPGQSVAAGRRTFEAVWKRGLWLLLDAVSRGDCPEPAPANLPAAVPPNGVCEKKFRPEGVVPYYQNVPDESLEDSPAQI